LRQTIIADASLTWRDCAFDSAATSFNSNEILSGFGARDNHSITPAPLRFIKRLLGRCGQLRCAHGELPAGE
jgi:hypothetical protein